MKLHELKPFPGEIKAKKRIGRGPASGQGCTAGKGNKGQNARAGKGPAPWFEGGQMPLVRRLPKRGFKNPFKVEYNVFNLEFIEKKFNDKDEITLEDLYKYCKKDRPIKILGKGEINKGFKIWAHKFSKSALEKINQAGGEAKVLEG
ncbi:50S ribosomal protein L15 [Desulfothermus okinawensis JCM 13304]